MLKNKKFQFNYIKAIIILIMLVMLNIDSVSAETIITSYADYVGEAGSKSCSTIYCATDLNSSGFRVTMIDYNGNQVSGTNIINFWPTANIKNYVDTGNTTYIGTSGYSCTTHKELKKSISYTNIFDSDLKIDSDKGAGLYKTYFQNLTANKVTKIISYLTNKDAVNYTDYYLKVEPIYVIKEQFENICGYYMGTSHEILNRWNYEDWNKEPYPSLGTYYIRGGCNSTIGGHWNVTRNYIVSMYYSCDNKSSGPNVSCYNGNKLEGYQSKSGCSSNTVSQLNSLYENGNGLGVGYFKISDYIDTCQTRANEAKGNSEKLTALYLEYKNKGKDYRNLLNFSNPKCTVKTDCNYESDVGCFSGSSGKSNTNDLSCYNDTVTANSVSSNQTVRGYCNVYSEITNKLGKDSFNAISGRMLIKRKKFSDVKVNLVCTFPEKIKSNTIKKSTYPLKISDYITFKVDNGDEKIELNKSILSTNFDIIPDSSFYNISLKANLSFSQKYAENGTGKITLTDCDNCKNLGYGYITKFNELSGQISFTYNFYTENFNSGDKTGTCNYTLNQELIKNDKLDVELRFIDTKTPFTRDTKSNWCGPTNCKPCNLTVIKNILCRPNSYGTSTCVTDINDLKNLNISLSDDKTCNVPDLITVSNIKPIYKITLTSSEILSIREYNKNHPYDDYNLECKNGKNCKSKFLETYGIKKNTTLQS